MATLFHFHDPMCSWCWAFKPAWAVIQSGLPQEIRVKRVLGGLAPDTDQPMPQEMRETIAGYWHRIETVVPGTRFNHEFWKRNTPRRATYPACRAVAAARLLAPEREESLVARIQAAYYLEAKNPSDEHTLISLATELGFDADEFARSLVGQGASEEFNNDLQLCANFGVQGFPSLVLQHERHVSRVRIDYNDASVSLSDIDRALAG